MFRIVSKNKGTFRVAMHWGYKTGRCEASYSTCKPLTLKIITVVFVMPT